MPLRVPNVSQTLRRLSGRAVVLHTDAALKNLPTVWWEPDGEVAVWVPVRWRLANHFPDRQVRMDRAVLSLGGQSANPTHTLDLGPVPAGESACVDACFVGHWATGIRRWSRRSARLRVEIEGARPCRRRISLRPHRCREGYYGTTGGWRFDPKNVHHYEIRPSGTIDPRTSAALVLYMANGTAIRLPPMTWNEARDFLIEKIPSDLGLPRPGVLRGRRGIRGIFSVGVPTTGDELVQG